MTASDTFRLTTGPYIPEEHAGFDLLPNSRARGGEVFSYPAELDAIDELVSEHEDGPDADKRTARLIPNGQSSYGAYFDLLADYASKYRKEDPELAGAIEWLAGATKRMNEKEVWSVVRYIGTEYDGDPMPDLTKNCCYYWPCSREKPVYEGVIDNEEFTSYLYPCDPGSWEIVLDPTGMAERALAGEADTVHGWKIELAEDPDSPEAWAKEMGVSAKWTRGASVFDDDLDEGWNASEADPVDIPCPGCGNTFHHDAWTLVNARRNPELVERLLAGTLFEFTCPKCGCTASLVNPCLYLDPEHGACIYLVVNDDMAEGAANMFIDMNEEDTPVGRSRKRIVRDRHQLRDKVALLRAGLDDRVAEVIKTAVIGQAKMQGLVSVSDTCEAYFERVDDDGSLVFDIAIGSSPVRTAIPHGGYDLFAGNLAKSSIACEQFFFVDRAWAHHAIDVFENEGIE